MYAHNVDMLKVYSNKVIRLVRVSSMKLPAQKKGKFVNTAFSLPTPKKENNDPDPFDNDLVAENLELAVTKIKNRPADLEKDDKKSDASISRSKRIIREYALCNEWEYFFTGTLDPKKYDRENLDKFRKDLTQFVRDQRKKYGCEIKYLFVPELHKDGKSWHMHGFLAGLPIQSLHEFKIGDKMGFYLVKKVRSGDEVYSWKDYQKRFGFCDIEPIKDPVKSASYITKYVTKSLRQAYGKHSYFCSRGLERAKTLVVGESDWCGLVPDFENEYCKIAELPYEDGLKSGSLAQLLLSFVHAPRQSAPLVDRVIERYYDFRDKCHEEYINRHPDIGSPFRTLAGSSPLPLPAFM